jgi:AcrR family transcriptional regulator
VSVTDPQTAPRRYRSRRRAQQAEQTRADVLVAAVELFAEHGWAATTITAVAERTGVVAETVYRIFGSKKELLRQAFQVTIVGDAAPVPLADRDEMQPIVAGPQEQRARAAAAQLVTVYRDRRLAAVWAAVLEAAAGDPEIATWRDEEEQRRLTTVKVFLDALGHPGDDALADTFWLISSPEAYLKLTTQRGWTAEQWIEWVFTMINHLSP